MSMLPQLQSTALHPLRAPAIFPPSMSLVRILLYYFFFEFHFYLFPIQIFPAGCGFLIIRLFLLARGPRFPEFLRFLQFLKFLKFLRFLRFLPFLRDLWVPTLCTALAACAGFPSRSASAPVLRPTSRFVLRHALCGLRPAPDLSHARIFHYPFLPSIALCLSAFHGKIHTS